MAETATKVRIYSLAKELGMENKELIEHCRAAGVALKGSSALASISIEDKQIVLDRLKGQKAEEKSTDEAETLTPSRETAPDLASRMRNLRTMAPRELPSRKPEPADEEVVQETVAATDSDAESEAAGEAAALADSEVTVEASGPDAPTAEDVATPEADSDVADDSGDDDAIRREDYVSGYSGSGGSVREMVPRGSPVGGGRREKPRARQTLPSLAPLPAFKPQVSNKESKAEPVAQKPEIRFTPEQLGGQSPLAARLKQTAEEKTRRGPGKKKTVEFTNSEEKKDRRGMGSLDSTRQARRKGRQRRGGDDDGDTRARRGRTRRKRTGPIDLKTSGTVELPITIRSLSEAIGRPAKQILTALFKRGHMATINEGLEEEIAWEIAAELGVELQVKREQSRQEYLTELLESEDAEEVLQPRPPIVTILGHVDHGKTSLLDKIRSTNVVDAEAGGITQHIRSYQVDHNGQKVTFVDTPGHAAFGEMRARGANVTDIVVLVVAANDSVMPQTVECISHAKASGAPIIVALNKVDLPDYNEQKILTDLSTNGVQPQEWGGEIEVIRTSAMTGVGIDDLLETILLTAEINELKANVDRDALGICLEAFRDEGLGPIAWLIVQKGTLKVGDTVACGPAHGRIRAIYNDRGESLEEAGPSLPVKVTGLSVVPGAGDHFFALEGIEQARAAAEEQRESGREASLANRGKPRTFDDILNAAREGAVQDLNVILKADTPGSIEAIRSELNKLDHPEVRVQILHEAVGGVNESDVYLASASDAVIVAFHVIAEDRAVALADAEGVEIRRYDIIYEVTDQIRQTLEGLLIPEKVQTATGRAIVLQTFSISRTGTIAGCRVLSGTIQRSDRMHVIRDQKVLNDYAIASLKRVKDDAKEVREGMECGIRLEGFNDVKEGDLLEGFRIDMIKRTFD